MPKRKEENLTESEREKFEYWLFEMDDVLEPLVAAAASAGYRLDYSLDSLDELEKYWLACGEGPADGTAANRAARYLGEVFRKQVGGTWALCDNGPRYLYNKLPVLSGYSRLNIEFCPMAVFGGFATRAEAGSLRRAVESHRLSLA
jgi:hypothetical protein